MANNRELSQLASLIVVDDTTRNIGIATTGFSNVGIGTTNPGNAFNFSGITSTTTKLDVRGKTLLFYDGDVSTGATSKSDMDTKAILKLRGTTNSSTNMQFATMSSDSGAMGIQVTNQANIANWDLLLNPFGGSVGIGTTLPSSKLYVYDANQNSDTYSSEVYRTSTNFSSGVGHRAYYESYYTTAGVQTSYASGINAQVSASVATGSTNDGYIRGGLDAVWRNNANAQSSTDNGTLDRLYGRGIQYGHFNDNAVSPITNTATGLYLTPYCYTGRIGTLIGLDINSVATAVGATATNVRGINCEIDTTDGTNPYNLYIGGNAQNYIAGSVGIGTTNPGAKLNVVDNSSSDALRITQTGSGNALVVEDSTNPDATRFVILPDGKVGVGTTGLIQYSSGVNDTSTFGILASTGNDSAFVLKGNNGSATDGSGQTLAILVGSSGGTGSGTNIIHYSHDTSGIGTRRNAIRFTDNQIRFEDNVSGIVDVTINSSGSGELLVGRTSSTGTSSQLLQVEGGAYVSGDLGIGTTNPITPLHISDGNGGISTALYTSDYLTISGQNTSPGFNIIAAGSDNANRGVFKATRARGTLSSPTVPLVNDDTFSLIGTIYDGSTGRATAAVTMEVDGTVGVGTAPQRITFWTGTGTSRFERVRITSSGNVGIGTTNPTSKLHVIGGVLVTGITTSTDFNSSSDINLKDNIERIQNPIDKLQQLDGVTFNWKETHRASVGVIAQQVEKVLPQLVSGDETKTVNYNGLIALLIECVKEQQIEINNLKEKLK